MKLIAVVLAILLAPVALAVLLALLLSAGLLVLYFILLEIASAHG